MKATLTSENSPEIKRINRSDADIIIAKIKKDLQNWKIKNYLYHALVGLLGTIAIVGSVIVSVYLDTESAVLTSERLKIIAIASTASLSILSAFNVLSKTNNYVLACDLMQVALFKYSAKLIGLDTLIEAYDKANKIIGGIDFNFDKNFGGTNGKTVVSVDTDEALAENEKEVNAPVGAVNNPDDPAAEAAGDAVRPNQKSGAEAPAGRLAGSTTRIGAGQTNHSAQTAAVKAEAIIDTAGVSVLVSEKE